MIWQDVVLLVAGGWVGHLTWVRELARRRSGKTIRDAILPARRKPEPIPSVTEIA